MKKKVMNFVPQIIINETASEIRKPVAYGVLLRFLIACLISVGFTFTLIDIYELPVNPSVCFSVTVGFQLLFFTAVSCVRKGFVLLGTGVVMSAAALIMNSSFIYSILYFKDCILKVLDSRLLDTLPYLTFKMWQLADNNISYQRGVMVVFVFIIAIVTLVTSLCTYRRPSFLVMLGVFCVLFASAFIAEKCEFSLSMIPLFTGIFMLYTISASFSSEKLLAGVKSYNVWASDREFAQRNRKRKLYKRLKHRMLRFGKYKTNAMWGAAIAVISLFTGAYLFRDKGYIDYSEVYRSISEAGQSIQSFVDSMGFGSDDAFNEYFSTSYHGRNNNRLSISSPGTGERDVVRVTVENPEDAVFLRGDIGVDFDGNGWSTLPQNSKSEYSELFDNYIPETETKTFYNILVLSGIDASEYIRLQNVQLDYLQNTDVVMLPTSPYEYSYRDNESFNVKGDTVIRTSDNFIETVECSVVYPVISERMATSFEWADDLVSLWDMNVLSSIALSSDIDKEKLDNYSEYQNEYKRYVYDTYLSIPEEMNDDLYNYLQSHFGTIQEHFANSTMSERYNSAYELCEFLKSNYSYSLDFEDNGKDGIMQFLNVTKSGHCALYASSMVLLLREMGIPARYCTGFVADGGGIFTNDGYQITLKEKNLHAWAEVYFNQYGWLPFDPTGASSDGIGTSFQTTSAGTSAPRVTSGHRISQTAPDASTGATKSPDSTPAKAIDFVPVFITAGIVLFVLFVVSLILFVVNTRKNMAALLDKLGKQSPTDAVKRMYRLLFVFLRLCGVEQKSGETLADFAARVDKLIVYENGFLYLTPLFEAVEFGREDVNEEERSAVLSYTLAVYNEIIGKRNFIKRIYLMHVILNESTKL